MSLQPRSAEELLEMLHFGNQNRTQHPTDANKQSSRSHAVFQVSIFSLNDFAFSFLVQDFSLTFSMKRWLGWSSNLKGL